MQEEAAESPGARFTRPRQPWSRLDTAVAVILAVVTIALRLSQRSKSLYTVDSVLFALATQRYDVLALRPHPPGYPLFVALGKLALPLVGGDVNAAFVLVSAVFSGIAVGALYALARQWASQRASLACAALFAFAPAFAFNGTIALSYTAEAAAGIAVALLAWRAWTRPTPLRLVALGVAWALAVGIRQSLFLFLAPVVGLALLDFPLRWPSGRAGWTSLARRVAIAGGASFLAAMAWFIPMAWATGGVAEWRRATKLQSDQVVFADAVWKRGTVALSEHWDRLSYFLHWEAALLIPLTAVLALAGLAVARRRRAPSEPGPWPAGAGILLAAWLLPALAFYLLVFDGWERGPIGYVLTLLPGLYVLAVLLSDHGLRRLTAAQKPIVARVLPLFGLVLLLVPLPGLATQANAYTEHEAKAHDDWTASWQALATEYPANDTAILTWQSWSHVEWYFPDHLAWTYFPSYRVPGQTDWALIFAMQHHEQEGRFIEMYEQGPGRPDHPIPPQIKTIVLFDFQLAGENGEARRLDAALDVHEEHLASGWRILTIHPDAEHPTVESLFTPEALGQGSRKAAP